MIIKILRTNDEKLRLFKTGQPIALSSFMISKTFVYSKFMKNWRIYKIFHEKVLHLKLFETRWFGEIH